VSVLLLYNQLFVQ